MLQGDSEESEKDGQILAPIVPPINSATSPTTTQDPGFDVATTQDPGSDVANTEGGAEPKEEKNLENGPLINANGAFAELNNQNEAGKMDSDVQASVISMNGGGTLVKNEKPYSAGKAIASSTTQQSMRKFRAIGLHYPGDDIRHPDIVAVMLACQSFHMWFEREPNKDISRKKGGISFTFDDEASAREAYMKIKDLTFGDSKLKFHAPKSFDEIPVQAQEQPVAETVAPVDQEDPELFQKIFVEQLVPNADETLIYAVFGKDNLKRVDIRVDSRKADGSKCAVLTFHDREAAEQAKEYDEFAVDDGDVSRPMRISLYADHLKKVETERQRKNRPTPAVESAKVECPSGQDNETVGTSRRLANEQKGKAGNMWSAQIVENRGEPVEIIKAKNRAQRDNDSHARPGRLMSSATEQLSEVEPQWMGISPDKQQSLIAAESTVATAAAPPPPPPSEPEEPKAVVEQNNQRPPSRAAGEMNAHELSVLIEAAMVRGRVNWAELNTLEELWSLVHHASKDAGWQPEMSLKEAMAVVLDRAYRNVEADWQRDHLASLIRIWKKELEIDSRSQIRKQLQLAEHDSTSEHQQVNEASTTAVVPGADYTPLPSEKRGKKSKAAKKALMHMMGVGALLADVKKEVAEQDQQVKTSKSAKKGSEPEKRKRKHSASESGEASTTTEDEDGETSDWEEGTVSSSDYRRKQHGKQTAQRPLSRPQRKKLSHSEAKAAETVAGKVSMPAADQVANFMTTMMQSMAGGGSNVQQQWMAQAMPMMLQMMPMMAQMMQAQRMVVAASANATQAQQQQQMQQQMMQMMQQMMGAASSQSAAPAHPQAYQQPAPTAAVANPMASWMQQQTAHRPVNAAPPVPAAGHQLPYFGRHQQPPPPPAGPYGSYGGRGGDQGSMYPVRGNYSR